jgi:hypothetical protein
MENPRASGCRAEARRYRKRKADPSLARQCTRERALPYRLLVMTTFIETLERNFRG